MIRKSSALTREVGRYERRLAKARQVRETKAATDAAWDLFRRRIYDLEKGRCRAFGTLTIFQQRKEKRGDPRKRATCHHVTFRSAGGKDIESNCCNLGWEAHDMIHGKDARYALDCDGNADRELRFTLKDAETGKVLRRWVSAR